MIPKNHYNVVLKNASGLYIGVSTNPFEKIIGLSKLDRSLGDDIDLIKKNQIGIVYTDYENEELTLKRIYTIGSDNEALVDLLTIPRDKLYELVTTTVTDYAISNPL